MGAVTDEALRLAREIASNELEHDEHMATWRRGQIAGILYLALAMDFDAAWDVRTQFDSLIDQLKTREAAP